MHIHTEVYTLVYFNIKLYDRGQRQTADENKIHIKQKFNDDKLYYLTAVKGELPEQLLKKGVEKK